jgi:hypothetical protein
MSAKNCFHDMRHLVVPGITIRYSARTVFLIILKSDMPFFLETILSALVTANHSGQNPDVSGFILFCSGLF